MSIETEAIVGGVLGGGAVVVFLICWACGCCKEENNFGRTMRNLGSTVRGWGSGFWGSRRQDDPVVVFAPGISEAASSAGPAPTSERMPPRFADLITRK